MSEDEFSGEDPADPSRPIYRGLQTFSEEDPSRAEDREAEFFLSEDPESPTSADPSRPKYRGLAPFQDINFLLQEGPSAPAELQEDQLPTDLKTLARAQWGTPILGQTSYRRDAYVVGRSIKMPLTLYHREFKGPFSDADVRQKVIPARAATAIKPHSAGWGDWRRRAPNAIPLPEGPNAPQGTSSVSDFIIGPTSHLSKKVHSVTLPTYTPPGKISPRLKKKNTNKLEAIAVKIGSEDVKPSAIFALSREVIKLRKTSMGESESDAETTERKPPPRTDLASSNLDTSPVKVIIPPKVSIPFPGETLTRLQKPTQAALDKTRNKIRVDFLPSSKGIAKEVQDVIFKPIYEPLLPPPELTQYMDNPDSILPGSDMSSLSADANRRAAAINKTLSLGGERQAILESQLEHWVIDRAYLNSMPIGSSSNVVVKKKPSRSLSPKLKDTSTQHIPVNALSSTLIRPETRITDDDITWATFKMKNHGFSLEQALVNPIAIRNKVHHLLRANKRMDAMDLRRAITIALTREQNHEVQNSSILPAPEVMLPSRSRNLLDRGERLEAITRARGWLFLTTVRYASIFIDNGRRAFARYKLILLLRPLILRWVRRAQVKLYNMHLVVDMQAAIRPTVDALCAASLAVRFIDSTSEVQKLIQSLKVHVFYPHEIIWHKCEPAHRMYLVVKGTVEHKTPDDERVEFITSYKGSVLEDFATVMGVPHNCYGTAGKEGCIMWGLDRSDLLAALPAGTLTQVQRHLRESMYQQVFSALVPSTPLIRSSCEMFAKAPDAVLAALCQSVIPIELTHGKVWRSGATSTQLLIVASGTLSEVRGKAKKKYTIGDCVGWFELLFCGLPRLSGVYADGKVFAWCIHVRDFRMALQFDRPYLDYAKQFGTAYFKQLHTARIPTSAFRGLAAIPTDPYDGLLITELQDMAGVEIVDHKACLFGKMHKPTKLYYVEQGELEVCNAIIHRKVGPAPFWLGFEQWVSKAETWGFDLCGNRYAIVHSLSVVDIRAALLRSHKRREGLKQKALLDKVLHGEKCVSTENGS